jgi:hypothetical protein
MSDVLLVGELPTQLEDLVNDYGYSTTRAIDYVTALKHLSATRHFLFTEPYLPYDQATFSTNDLVNFDLARETMKGSTAAAQGYLIRHYHQHKLPLPDFTAARRKGPSVVQALHTVSKGLAREALRQHSVRNVGVPTPLGILLTEQRPDLTSKLYGNRHDEAYHPHATLAFLNTYT